jgi:hypothetical protein
MFFTNEQCENYKTCQKCQQVFKDPRYLPCGECICAECIEDNSNCFFCEEKHIRPKIGFPICKKMVSFLDKKPEGYFTMNSLNNFKSELESMGDELNNFKTKFKNSDESINQHCQMLKDQIDVKTEKIIEKIIDIKQQLYSKVDDYQSECKSNMNINNFNFSINENQQLLDEYYQYIKRQRINENEITQMMQTVVQRKISLKKEISKLEFNENKLNFLETVDDIDSSLIGTLNSEPEESKEEALTINLKDQIEAVNWINEVFFFDNGNFLIIYTSGFDQCISIFDHKFKLSQTLTLLDLFKGQIFQKLWNINTNNEIMVNYLSENNYSLAILDQTLHIKKIFICETKYISIFGHSQRYYGFHQETIDVYDLNFELLQKIGQTYNCQLLFYFGRDNKTIIQAEIFNEKYILRSVHNIRIIDALTGNQQGFIIIKHLIHQMILKCNTIHLIGTCKDNDNDEFVLSSYDLDGKLQSNCSLNCVDKDYFFFYKNENVIFILNKQTLQISKYRSQ